MNDVKRCDGCKEFLDGYGDHCYTIIRKIYDSRGGELSIKGKKGK